MPGTARLDAPRYHSGQYSGHMVRVAGKLLRADGDRMQIQMAGEGAIAHASMASGCVRGEIHISGKCSELDMALLRVRQVRRQSLPQALSPDPSTPPPLVRGTMRSSELCSRTAP
jgi:hypothetical protein